MMKENREHACRGARAPKDTRTLEIGSKATATSIQRAVLSCESLLLHLVSSHHMARLLAEPPLRWCRREPTQCGYLAEGLL